MAETSYTNVFTRQVTIANGESLSAGIALGGTTETGIRLFGIQMPAEWTTANLTFQASTDNGATYNNLYDSTGTEVTIVAAAARYIVLDPATFAAVTNLKVRSGTSGTAVNQAADRTLVLTLRSV